MKESLKSLTAVAGLAAGLLLVYNTSCNSKQQTADASPTVDTTRTAEAVPKPSPAADRPKPLPITTSSSLSNPPTSSDE
jgi:hypothetical protein